MSESGNHFCLLYALQSPQYCIAIHIYTVFLPTWGVCKTNNTAPMCELVKVNIDITVQAIIKRFYPSNVHKTKRKKNNLNLDNYPNNKIRERWDAGTLCAYPYRANLFRIIDIMKMETHLGTSDREITLDLWKCFRIWFPMKHREALSETPVFSSYTFIRKVNKGRQQESTYRKIRRAINKESNAIPSLNNMSQLLFFC